MLGVGTKKIRMHDDICSFLQDTSKMLELLDHKLLISCLFELVSVTIGSVQFVKSSIGKWWIENSLPAMAGRCSPTSNKEHCWDCHLTAPLAVNDYHGMVRIDQY